MTRPLLELKKPSFWTANKIQALKDANEEGFSAAEMGRILGCSRCAVMGKMRRLKIPLSNAVGTKGQQMAHIQRKPKTIGYTRAATEVSQTLDEPPSLAVSIADIKDGMCRWISGDVQQGATFCGQPAVDGSWCIGHRARVYQPIKP